MTAKRTLPKVAIPEPLASFASPPEIGHLVIGRKPGQSILIGSDIEVTLMRIRTGNVRISVRAPVDVPILRSELASHG